MTGVLRSTVVALGAGVAIVLPAVPGLAATTSTTTGGFNVSSGGTVSAGYDYTLPGFNGTLNNLTVSASAVASYTCQGGSDGTLPIDLGSWTADPTGSGWWPSGDQGSPAVWQGSAQAPSCSGTLKVTGVSYVADLTADAPSSGPMPKVNMRFHADACSTGCNAGWSGTVSVTPDTRQATPASSGTSGGSSGGTSGTGTSGGTTSGGTTSGGSTAPATDQGSGSTSTGTSGSTDTSGGSTAGSGAGTTTGGSTSSTSGTAGGSVGGSTGGSDQTSSTGAGATTGSPSSDNAGSGSVASGSGSSTGSSSSSGSGSSSTPSGPVSNPVSNPVSSGYGAGTGSGTTVAHNPAPAGGHLLLTDSPGSAPSSVGGPSSASGRSLATAVARQVRAGVAQLRTSSAAAVTSSSGHADHQAPAQDSSNPIAAVAATVTHSAVDLSNALVSHFTTTAPFGVGLGHGLAVPQPSLALIVFVAGTVAVQRRRRRRANFGHVTVPSVSATRSRTSYRTFASRALASKGHVAGRF